MSINMNLLTTKSQFEKEVKNILKSKPKYIYICTFGLSVNKLFEDIIKSKCKDIRLIIGLHKPSDKKIKFITGYLSKYNIKFRIKNKSHTKLFLTDKGGLLGGRNFTGSDWDDITIKVTKSTSINELKQYFINKF